MQARHSGSILYSRSASEPCHLVCNAATDDAPRVDTLASQSGAIIVPSAAHDSVPADLSTFLSVQTLQRHCETSQKSWPGVTTSETAFIGKMSPSGGTLATVITGITSVPRDIRMASLNAYALSPGTPLALLSSHSQSDTLNSSRPCQIRCHSLLQDSAASREVVRVVLPIGRSGHRHCIAELGSFFAARPRPRFQIGKRPTSDIWRKLYVQGVLCAPECSYGTHSKRYLGSYGCPLAVTPRTPLSLIQLAGHG